MEGRSASFFFQAEDGIRDIGVTGVQTCALPIFMTGGGGYSGAALLAADDLAVPLGLVGLVGADAVAALAAVDDVAALVARSEERRVGKEGRSRGSPYH